MTDLQPLPSISDVPADAPPGTPPETRRPAAAEVPPPTAAAPARRPVAEVKPIRPARGTTARSAKPVPVVVEEAEGEQASAGGRKRIDRRGQWTLKDAAFDNEFKAIVRKAAERQGMGMSQWVAATLREEAMRILKGQTADSPVRGAVARPEDDILKMLAERLERLERLATEGPVQPLPNALPQISFSERLRWIFGF